MAHDEDNETTAVLEADASAEAPAKPKRAPRKKKEAAAPAAEEAPAPAACRTGVRSSVGQYREPHRRGSWG